MDGTLRIIYHDTTISAQVDVCALPFQFPLLGQPSSMRKSRVRSYVLISDVVLLVDVRLISLLGVDLGLKVDLDRDTSRVHVFLKQGDWVTAEAVLFQGLF